MAEGAQRLRATRARIALGTLAACAAVLAPSDARAHAPLFFAPTHTTAATPLRVVDGTVSVAAYGVLTRRTRSLVLAVRLPGGAREPLEVLLPDGSAAVPAVEVSVRGPGGAWRPVTPLRSPERFFEPYGGQRYLRTHRATVGPRGGWTLVRVVLPPGSNRRAVCVATGTREVGFAGLDLDAALERIRRWAGG